MVYDELHAEDRQVAAIIEYVGENCSAEKEEIVEAVEGKLENLEDEPLEDMIDNLSGQEGHEVLVEENGSYKLGDAGGSIFQNLFYT